FGGAADLLVVEEHDEGDGRLAGRFADGVQEGTDRGVAGGQVVQPSGGDQLPVRADATGGGQVVGHRVVGQQVVQVGVDELGQPAAEGPGAGAQTPVGSQVLLVVELEPLGAHR